MVEKIYIEFMKKYSWGGVEYARHDRVQPSDVGMTLDEAHNLELEGVVKFVTIK